MIAATARPRPASFAYAEPLEVNDPALCTFYHRMEVPGIGEVGTQWDLRDCIDEYLGNYDWAGKRVLDVGCASGFLTFEMERRGADVVSFDMDGGHRWNCVPYYNQTPQQTEQYRQAVIQGHQRMVNGYWLVHRALGSRAQAFYGDIYDLPEELGAFDAVYFGMIITHLRDPFQALYSASRLSQETVIVTNQLSGGEEPTARFVPDIQTGENRVWWIPTAACLEQMLGVLGFVLERTVVSHPVLLTAGRPGPKRCTSFVFRRMH
jgi:SAM-dependent methyltransferase